MPHIGALVFFSLLAVAVPATAVMASAFVLFSRGTTFRRVLGLSASAALLALLVGSIQFSYGSPVGYSLYFGLVAGVFFTWFVAMVGWLGHLLELFPEASSS